MQSSGNHGYNSYGNHCFYRLCNEVLPRSLTDEPLTNSLTKNYGSIFLPFFLLRNLWLKLCFYESFDIRTAVFQSSQEQLWGFYV